MRFGTVLRTTPRTGFPGLVLVVVLGAALALSGPVVASGAPGEPFGTALPASPTDPPVPVGVWPLDPVPEVVTGFDPPSSTWGAGHRGVDLLGSIGQPVRSALAGTVSFAGTIAGRGVVVVDHGDTRTTYEPVGAGVDVGDPVGAGGRLGVLQLPGSHCFPRACLHWGWLRGTTYLDPLLLVGAGPVRLLPLWREEPIDVQATMPPWQPLPRAYAGWRPLLELLGPRAERPNQLLGLDTPVATSSLGRAARSTTIDESAGASSSLGRAVRSTTVGTSGGLRPRMRLLVGPAEPVGGHVGVELRRRE